MIVALFTLAGCTGRAPPPERLILDDYGEVPPFSLLDQSGATVTRESFAGKVWVADFFFTSCPDVCPILSAHLAEVQGHYRAAADLRLVSFSVDPATDTPPVLAEYAGRFQVEAGRWYLLTGPLDEVKALVVDGFKQALEDVPASEQRPATILHGSRFVVVDRRGRIRAFPMPEEPGKVELYAAVDALLGER